MEAAIEEEEPTPNTEAESDSVSLESLFKYETGAVELKDGIATIQVPQGFKYLNGEQTKVVLENLWGNPPSEEAPLGMLFPLDKQPTDEDCWGIEITFEQMGYIKDDDAKDLDYDELLSSMQADEAEINEARKEMGFEPVYIIGWASPPFYDQESKKLHWAKELKFGEDEIHTLNYNIRILGRKGMLVLNAIGTMEQLEEIKTHTPTILANVNFSPGNQYADFDPSIDEVAAIGIGGLIAGKVLAKAGFFALLAKFWKLIVAGVIGVFAFARRILFGQKDESNKGV